jgi:hypothetical protein
MIYFDDAEEDNDPELLKGQNWEDVKGAICMAVKSCKSLSP